MTKVRICEVVDILAPIKSPEILFSNRYLNGCSDGLRAGWPAEARHFLLVYRIQTGSEAHPVSNPMCGWAHSLGITRLRA